MVHVMSKPPERTRQCDGLHRSGVTPIEQYNRKYRGYDPSWLRRRPSHIAQSVLHQIVEDHRIAEYAQEASTSHEPSIRPPVSSTPTRMQPIRGRGEREGEGEGEGELIAEVVLEMVGHVMIQTVTAV